MIGTMPKSPPLFRVISDTRTDELSRAAFTYAVAEAVDRSGSGNGPLMV